MLENRLEDQGVIPATRALAERRAAQRSPVIKSGRLELHLGGGGQGVYNCLVLDESPSGVLIDLGALFALPEDMILHMSGGATYKVRRCWAVGTKAGLEFVGEQILSPEAAAHMGRLAELLHTQGVVATVAALRSRHYFDYEKLRRAAEEVEQAYNTLQALLSPKG